VVKVVVELEADGSFSGPVDYADFSDLFDDDEGVL
jgi:hypothetical protein